MPKTRKPTTPVDAQNPKKTNLLTLQQKVYLRSKQINPEAPHQLDLIFPEIIGDRKDLRHLPNDIARSSLFAVASRGTTRKLYKEQPIFSVDQRVQIVYNGEELRAADDELVWLQLVKYAESVPTGTPFKFTLAQLIHDLGWQRTGNYYTIARESIKRLTNGNLWINNQRAFGTSGILYLLFGTVCLNDETGNGTEFSTSIDPKSILLFAGNHFSSHKWLQYRKLSPTARRLSDYAASHQHPFPLHINKFKAMCASTSNTVRKWRQQVKSACSELVAAELACAAGVNEDDMIFCTRKTLKSADAVDNSLIEQSKRDKSGTP